MPPVGRRIFLGFYYVFGGFISNKNVFFCIKCISILRCISMLTAYQYERRLCTWFGKCVIPNTNIDIPPLTTTYQDSSNACISSRLVPITTFFFFATIIPCKVGSKNTKSMKFHQICHVWRLKLALLLVSFVKQQGMPNMSWSQNVDIMQ